MSNHSRAPGPAVVTAMVCAGAVSAQFIAGKATRDALYLGALDVTSLPAIIVATSAFSILLVALSSRTLRRVSPATVIPLAFAVNAALLLLAWAVVDDAPQWTARALYLQVSGLGPMLGSGFWLIATEMFDPRTARRHFGQIAGVGTLSGLGGALVAERVGQIYGVTAMLPLLAALSLVCAWQVRRLARTSTGVRPLAPPHAALRREYAPTDAPIPDRQIEGASDLLAVSPQSGLRVLSRVSYLQNLAMLVLLGTVGATLADYIFKVRAVEMFGNGDTLLRFFAIYYAATSLLAFVIQATTSTLALEKLGLALTTSTPALALTAGGLGAMVFPGLEGALVARGGESVFRGSLFRTGYELFFTPVPPAEKRAAKSIIDVGFDRLGDAVGGGLVSLLILLPAARQHYAILAAAVLCALAALLVARRLNAGYIHTLERSLLDRAVELDLGDIEDVTTRTVMLRSLQTLQLPQRTRQPDAAAHTDQLLATDPEIQDILDLRSRNRERVLAVLRDDTHPPATLIPHVIPLLAWDPVAEDAARALRRIVEDHVGELTDALIDPNQPFAVRRRLARVFSTGVSQRAVDGLLLGLEDLRFEVRFQCGRSLATILSKNSMVRIDQQRVFDAVRREVAVGRPVWQSHRLLDGIADDDSHPFVDGFLKDRANQSLGHVFTLLSLVLPATPLQIAYRGLHTSDPGLRGTALEYLEGVLPADIRDRLWPFLDDGPPPRQLSRSREEILADLLRSNESIVMNLEELRRRASTGA
jgi:ATP:ADP antiporter, AAA family